MNITNKALAIDPQNVAAHTLDIYGRMIEDQDYQPAIDDIVRLVTRYPNHPDPIRIFSLILRMIGRSDLDMQVMKKYVEVDPLSPNQHIGLAVSLIYEGDL